MFLSFFFFSFFILAVVDVPVNDIRPIYPASIYSRPMDVSVQNTFVHCPINRFFFGFVCGSSPTADTQFHFRR